MNIEKQSYRHIFKATSLFGGVQIIQLILNLVKGKLIAILLGSSGIGILNLYLSSTTMISNITGLGLSFSAVRDISLAAETMDNTKISRISKIFRRWIFFSGLLGVAFTIGCSSLLSEFAFGNSSQKWSFVFLSITLMLNSQTNGNNALLQGLRKLKDMAKSSVIGSAIGLFSSIPLYYYYGIIGIVPSILITSLTSFITSFYFTNKIKIKPIYVSHKDVIAEGQEMVKLGVIMMISVFFGAVVVFIVNAFIRYKGGTSDVGLYQAGLSISNQIVGLVFVAMGSDYFPRLSAISGDNGKVKALVNHQAEIVILIAAPLLIALLISAPLIVQIFLSSEFFPIIIFIRMLAIGLLFKAAAYSVGYITFAKGDKRVFFIVDGFLSNIVTLLLNLFAYNFWGFHGLGISFIASFIIYFIVILIITNKLYAFTFCRTFYKLFAILLTLCLTAFVLTIFTNVFITYIGGSILFIISCIFSLLELDRRIEFKSHLISLLKKNKRI